MAFQGFPKEGLELLLDIEINNNKEWFEANRDRHERYIVSPNKEFIEELGEELQVLVPSIHAIPKTNKSLFKIYRDSRFHLSEPIKTKIGIIFWQGGGHRMQSSSFYMHYSNDEIFVASGIRNLKPPLLSAYRSYIQHDEAREELHQILQELQSKGYQIPEPHFKRCPRDMNCDDEYSYLYRYRAIFASSGSISRAVFHSKKVIGKCFEIYSDMLELQQWVYRLTLHQSQMDMHHGV